MDQPLRTRLSPAGGADSRGGGAVCRVIRRRPRGSLCRLSLPPLDGRREWDIDRNARQMIRFYRYALLLLFVLGLPISATAQVETGRGAALDHLGRGTAAFRTGDMAAAVREWSETIRLARLSGTPDLEAQALARR